VEARSPISQDSVNPGRKTIKPDVSDNDERQQHGEVSLKHKYDLSHIKKYMAVEVYEPLAYVEENQHDENSFVLILINSASNCLPFVIIS
jgi:hypothetical protein